MGRGGQGRSVLPDQQVCLERLPEPQRRAIRLFFYDDCSYADIAAATAWHLKSVKSYLQNGKRNLKICLENRLR